MPMIPIIDLKAQYESIKKEIDEAIQGVVSSGGFILGKEVEMLESEIAAYTGARFAVGVNSGTDALLLALKACGIGPGDEVITTAFSFFATAEVIALLGAKPVFIDIDPEDFNIDVRQIEAGITAQSKAIIPVHLYGQPAEMDRIMAIAAKHKLKVIEDCAQALGAEYHGKRVGSIGDIGCISFFPTKNLGAYGDGGMIVTRDEQTYQLINKLHLHGEKEKYRHELVGYNSRLDTIQAAIVRAKLKYLDRWNARRREIAEIYSARLTGVIIPAVKDNCRPVFNQYTIRTEKRDDLQKYLKANLVGSAVHYPIPMHLQEAFSGLSYKSGDFPVAEKISTQVLSLPVYPELSSAQIECVVAAVNKFNGE